MIEMKVGETLVIDAREILISPEDIERKEFYAAAEMLEERLIAQGCTDKAIHTVMVGFGIGYAALSSQALRDEIAYDIAHSEDEEKAIAAEKAA
ncbi:TPA: hypothetical protein NPO55_004872 [Klebsiella pneumoniae]|nr:hypothetical protein [Klebsiella pneumoniae]